MVNLNNFLFMANTYIHAYIHTYIQTDRQTDRQTDKYTYIHIYIYIVTGLLNIFQKGVISRTRRLFKKGVNSVT